jgi:hypothetical protein
MQYYLNPPNNHNTMLRHFNGGDDDNGFFSFKCKQVTEDDVNKFYLLILNLRVNERMELSLKN